MLVPETSLCVARGSDRTAIEALHILTTCYNRRTELLCGRTLQAPPNSVAFLAAERITFPSKYLRIIRASAEPESRAGSEYCALVRQHEWIRPASIVVCINHQRQIHPEYRAGLERALRDLCGVRCSKKQTDPRLLPEQKKQLRIARRRSERQAGYLYSGW